MRIKPPVALGYFVLLLSALGVPILHLYLADRAIEHTRMSTGFLPAHFLFLRWFGELSWLFPVAVIACFLLSLRHDQFTRATTILGLAALQLMFLTVYAAYCAFMLSHLLLERVA